MPKTRRSKHGASLEGVPEKIALAAAIAPQAPASASQGFASTLGLAQLAWMQFETPSPRILVANATRVAC